MLSGDSSSLLVHLRGSWSDLQSFLSLSDFQRRLLHEFSLILAGNALLVLLAWRLYGPRISDRFLTKRAPGAAIQEIKTLQTGINELKLPKEQDFRVK